MRALVQSASYRRADQDLEFLSRDALRGSAFRWNSLKTELIQRQENVRSTIVVFGSAHIPDPAVSCRCLRKANELLARNTHDKTQMRKVAQAKRPVALSNITRKRKPSGG